MANNIDPISLIMGWLVGRRIAGQRGKKQKEPIAYLYNGVRLPKLPEWDRERYPFAALNFIYSGENLLGAFLYCLPSVEYGTANGERTVNLSGALRCRISSGDSQWGAVESTSGSVLITALDWADFDILNVDGTVYLAASQPIPVYDDIDATLTDGVLYIKKAPAKLNGNTLEVL